MPQLSSLNRNLGWSLYLGLVLTPDAAYKLEVSRNVASTWHIELNHNPKTLEPTKALPEGNFQPLAMKYEVTGAGATTALAPRVKASPLPKEPAQSQRKTAMRPTRQQGEHGSSQPVPQWLLNLVSLEIGLNLAALTTLIRRTLKRQLL